MNWRFQLMKAKHEVRKTLHVASNVLQANLWKIAIIVLISLIVLRKDVSLQLNLKSPMQLEQSVPSVKAVEVQPELTSQKTHSKTSLGDVIETVLPKKKVKSIAKLPKKQSAIASQFSNLGFIFMTGSLIKFGIFFIVFYPGYKTDGDIQTLEFTSFFTPYAICLIIETYFLVKLLNQK